MVRYQKNLPIGRKGAASMRVLALRLDIGLREKMDGREELAVHENLPDIHQTSGEGLPHSPEFRWRCLLHVQKYSRRLELSIEKKNTPPLGRWEQGLGSVDPRFPEGLPFPVPGILQFVAFRDSGKIFSGNFPVIFPEFSLGTPEQTPETATAFSSSLICG